MVYTCYICTYTNNCRKWRASREARLIGNIISNIMTETPKTTERYTGYVLQNQSYDYPIAIEAAQTLTDQLIVGIFKKT